MSDWKEGFYEAIKQYARLPDDAVVTEVSESVTSYGGCDTCGPDYQYNTEIVYSTSTKQRNWTSIDVSLAEFINTL